MPPSRGEKREAIVMSETMHERVFIFNKYNIIYTAFMGIQSALLLLAVSDGDLNAA
jgi:hypothetical protein